MSAKGKYDEEAHKLYKYLPEYEKTHGKLTSFEDALKFVQWLREQQSEEMKKLDELFLEFNIQQILERQKEKPSYVS